VERRRERVGLADHRDVGDGGGGVREDCGEFCCFLRRIKWRMMKARVRRVRREPMTMPTIAPWVRVGGVEMMGVFVEVEGMSVGEIFIGTVDGLSVVASIGITIEVAVVVDFLVLEVVKVVGSFSIVVVVTGICAIVVVNVFVCEGIQVNKLDMNSGAEGPVAVAVTNGGVVTTLPFCTWIPVYKPSANSDIGERVS
jgi:hypothetical protein